MSPQQAFDVVALAGKQAQVQLTFGGQAGTVAVAAESLGNAADDADFAQLGVVLAISAHIAPTLSSFAGGGRVKLYQRHARVNVLNHLAACHHLVHAPAIGCAYIHVFNKAQRNARALKMPRHGQNFLLVRAAFDDHVDFDVFEARFLRRLDPVQNVGHWKINIVHGAKRRVVQPVQADGDALQACVFQGLGLAAKQRSIGG